MGAVAAVTIAAIVTVVTVVALATTGRNSAPATVPPAALATTTTAATEAASPSHTEASTADSVPTDEDSARRLLQNQVTQDYSQVEALSGQWVPQLSSKRFGLVADGTTYDYRAIWSDFTGLRTRYPGALLLWSGDYSGFRLSNFWVTIAPQPYSSGMTANGWCDSAGIDKDNCYAKRITHTGRDSESTMLRK